MVDVHLSPISEDGLHHLCAKVEYQCSVSLDPLGHKHVLRVFLVNHDLMSEGSPKLHQLALKLLKEC